MKKLWIFLFILTFLLCGCHEAEETEPVTEVTVQTESQVTQTLETQVHAQSNALSEDQLADFQSLFDDPMGWYARALTSEYISASQVDLEKMFYCGAGDTPVSEEEREYLVTRWIPELFDFDIVRCDKNEMGQALQLVFGLGLEEMEGIGLDRMTEYNDAYFRSTSDVLVTLVRFDSGIWLSDTAAQLYYPSDEPDVGRCCVTVELLDGRWVIRSNMQNN